MLKVPDRSLLPACLLPHSCSLPPHLASNACFPRILPCHANLSPGLFQSAYDPTNPWSKVCQSSAILPDPLLTVCAQPSSTATKQATSAVLHEPFVKQYTFHIDPTKPDPEHVLMTTTSPSTSNPARAVGKEASVKSAALAPASLNTKMEEKPVESTATKSSNGSPRSASPGGSTKPEARGLEDIWKEPSPTTAHPIPTRRRNGTSSF